MNGWMYLLWGVEVNVVGLLSECLKEETVEHVGRLNNQKKKL